MNNIDFKDMGSRIRKKRKEHGLTQEKLAELLEIDRTTIMKWEKGDMNGKIDFPTFIELCSELEMDMAFLLGDIYSNREIETVCEYTGLSEIAAKELHNMKTDNDSVIHTLNDLIENHRDSFMGIVENIRTYCTNLLIHDFLNIAKKEKKLQEHHLNNSSLALMNCQQWINYIGHNAASDKYFGDSITPYLKRIMKSDNNS